MCVTTRTRAFFFSALAILATGSISAQQNPQPSSAAHGLPHARIRCDNEPYVSLTADPERALPLEEVAKADCNERVTIVSDPGNYTVRVVTADGSVGYVARHELVFEPPKASAVAQSAPLATSPSGAPMQAQVAPAPTGEKGPAKPRVYLSDTQSWNETEGFSNPSSVAPDKLYAGYNPEMADVYQNFTSDCAAVTFVQEKSNADYAILFDKGASKKGLTGLGGLVKVNKVTVLSRNGETIATESSHSADVAVKSACDAIAQRASATSASKSKLTR
jgi:hypothetical protein